MKTVDKNLEFLFGRRAEPVVCRRKRDRRACVLRYLAFAGAGGSAPAAPPFNPASIVGLQLWNKSYSGLFTDVAGTVPCASNGDNVRFITDYSSNANNLTNAGTVPVYETNQQNGLPAIQQNAVPNGTVNLGVPIVLGGTFTLYATQNFKNATNAYVLADNSTVGKLIGLENGNKIVTYADSFSSVNVAYAGSFTSWLIFRLRRDASNNVKLQFTGQSEESLGSLSGNITVNSNMYWLASTYASTGSQLGETILYNVDVTTVPANDAGVTGYLSKTWGIAWP